MSTITSPHVPELDGAFADGFPLGLPFALEDATPWIRRDRGWLIRRALVLSEVIALLVAFLFATLVVKGISVFATTHFWREVPVVLLAVPLWVVAAKVAGLYDRDVRFASYSSTEDIPAVFGVATFGALAVLFIWHLAGSEPGWGRIAVAWLAIVPLVIAGRTAARAVVRRSSSFHQNTVIVGSSEVGRAVAQKFRRHPETGIDVIGFVDANAADTLSEIDGLPVLGTTAELPSFARELDVERVVIAFSADRHTEVLALVRELRKLRVHVDIVPRFVDVVGPGTDVHDIEGMPLIGLATLSLSRSSLITKRALDVAVALPLLVLLAPVFLLAALTIKLDSRGPIFFLQTRMGFHHKPFRLFKFRTMTADAEQRKHEVAHLNRHVVEGGDPRMFKIHNDPRVTRVGRILRRYFIDELPQLVNVVRGEMSLIGPRPLILEEAAFIDDWGHRRLDLKPGMTGSWQVLGRSNIAFEEMVKLDYHYVTTWSLGRDLRLLLRTVPLVLRGEPPV